MDARALGQIVSREVLSEVKVNLTPQQGSFLSCLLVALVACLPCFITELMKCLGDGDGGGSGYNPGDRKRCD